MIDALLLMSIIAGVGLSVAYLRAEYVLYRGLKAAEHKRLIVQGELRADRLRAKQIDARVADLRNHQDFRSKPSALRAPAELASTVYSRKSTDRGIARHRELV